MENRNLQTRLYVIAAIILLVGTGSAILIYLTADDDSDSILIYQFEHSKIRLALKFSHEHATGFVACGL